MIPIFCLFKYWKIQLLYFIRLTNKIATGASVNKDYYVVVTKLMMFFDNLLYGRGGGWLPPPLPQPLSYWKRKLIDIYTVRKIRKKWKPRHWTLLKKYNKQKAWEMYTVRKVRSMRKVKNWTLLEKSMETESLGNVLC